MKAIRRYQPFVIAGLLIIIVLSSIQCDTFISVPSFQDSSEPISMFSDADMSAVDAEQNVVGLAHLQMRSRSGISVLFKGQERNNGTRGRFLFIIAAIFFETVVFPILFILLAAQKDRNSLLFQRLVHYIHNKDGKKDRTFIAYV